MEDSLKLRIKASLKLLQSRDCKGNLAHYKNAQGTIKLPGQKVLKKVNIPDLMGLCEVDKLTEHSTSEERFNELCSYIKAA